MTLDPEARWLGGTIPIVFHWVLASYVMTVGHFHRAQLAAARANNRR
jgi:hypothetical protein